MAASSIRTVTLAAGEKQGPVVLCVPGAMCPPEVFGGMARRLGCRVLGLAWLEGDGPHDIASVSMRVAELAAQFPRVVLIGHSIGVPIVALAAQRCLSSNAAALQGIVLSNSGANTKGHGDIDAVIDRVLNAWGAEFWDDFIERCIGTPVPEPLLETFRGYPAALDPRHVAAAIKSQKDIDLLPMLSLLSAVPVAVVHGRMDPARSLAHAQELAAHIPGSSLHVLDTGHSSAAEQPDRFADIVRALIGPRYAGPR